MIEGDQVVIINPEHPHYGKIGTLKTTRTVFFPWRVELDAGSGGCVDEADVAVVESLA